MPWLGWVVVVVCCFFRWHSRFMISGARNYLKASNDGLLLAGVSQTTKIKKK
jgi:hypothetical protein